MSSPARLHYLHSLDTPLPVRAVEGVVRLQGWCFTPGGDARPQLQLRIGPLTLAAIAGTDRADVAAAFPAIPHAGHCGFEISGHVPAGLSVAELWAGREGFGWELLVSFSIYAEAAVLHGAIDLPVEKIITTQGPIDGWCFHPQRDIAEIWLHYGHQQVRCRHYGHVRADVATQFPHLPQARLSGFSTEALLKPGEGPVRLRAVDHEGGVYFCETSHTIRLPARTSVHLGGDPRLDGRALFRAFSGHQSELPTLRVIVPAAHREAAADVQRVARALQLLPGEKWQLIALADPTRATPELVAAVSAHPRLSLAPEVLPHPACWDLRISPEETPDVHGIMAALLATAEHPGVQAVYGDFATGENHQIHRQPAWSRDLALAGGIHPRSPVLLGGSLKIPPGQSPIHALAATRTATLHLGATLTHRPSLPPADLGIALPQLVSVLPFAEPVLATNPDRIRYEPSNQFRRPAITAIVTGDEKPFPHWREAFKGEVDTWLHAGADLSGPALTKAIQQTGSELLVFLPAGTRPVSAHPLAHLALHLADSPAAAAQPLLLHADLAPWQEGDLFSARTCRTLRAFDPAFATWTDRTLTLFTRQVPYLALPGLMIPRRRLLTLGGFDPHFESLAGALLDLAFRLRHAATPPLLCAEARLIATPGRNQLTAFEETLLLDRWDQDDANPLRLHPLVPTEVLA